MKNLQKILEGFDPKSKEIITREMNREFSNKPEVDWKKFLVRNDNEKKVTALLYQNKVWYFSAAGDLVVAKGKADKKVEISISTFDEKEPALFNDEPQLITGKGIAKNTVVALIEVHKNELKQKKKN